MLVKSLEHFDRLSRCTVPAEDCGLLWVVELYLSRQDVEQVRVGSDSAASGVVLKNGTEIHSKVVLSNATPYVTFKKLVPQVVNRRFLHVRTAADVFF